VSRAARKGSQQPVSRAIELHLKPALVGSGKPTKIQITEKRPTGTDDTGTACAAHA